MRNRAVLTLVLLTLASCQRPPQKSTEPAKPSEPPKKAVKIDAQAVARAEAAIETSIRRGDVPGAVLVLGRRDGVVYRGAFGKQFAETGEPMSVTTIFDLASLTKPVAGATAVMKLVEQGKIQLSDPVAQYIPAFGANGKQAVTVEQLLTHTSGLIADNAMGDYDGDHDAAMQNIYDLSLRNPPGKKFEYSDVGFIVLGELVRVVDGRPLDRFVAEEIYSPLKMNDTTYNPPAAWLKRIAPTEKQSGQWIAGSVHDPRSAALGGVAGHAGLFSTGDDLARYCMMLLNGGQLDGRRVLSEATIKTMTTPRTLADGRTMRTYGFDVQSSYSTVRGLRFEAGKTFGHTGFTGTMLWLDAERGVFAILLTSRLQMPGGGATSELRKVVMTHAADALLGPQEKPAVRTGIDALADENFATLHGRNVGLITNHTGIDRFGRRTIDLLHQAQGVKLAAIFSPEHGIAGKLDTSGIAHSTDEKTGLPIYSLFGETKRPSAEMLRGLDTLVFDIQDIGTRFYTYLTTMGHAMEGAERHGLRFVVLDRPNPILPLGPHGTLADEDKLSFVAYQRLPLTHGMTLGELAKLFKSQYTPKLDLQVVEMKNYRRGMWWDDTGVTWVNPSPNMRSPTQATLYPAVGVLEMTNISVGRGTPTPFELLGAPWVDGAKLATALTHSNLPGVRFEPIVFTPDASKFNGEKCTGVKLTLTDRNVFDPARTGLSIAWHLRNLHGEAFEHEKIQVLLVSDSAHQSWLTAEDPAKIKAQTPEDFLRLRKKHLIYK